ncbi:hypothetical protein LX32DRAFT_23840 [Colletotrichum zoysiae]|uniref:Uncharacterized protein n=1 Tax=Colletotrichum zoysiae TaxID=1216348 RepID=A0AAD9HRG2_9PEZI|nr:hypothetical protein LX32DRAFT_23840 [Colletotrichum zoysiae]
MAWRGFLSGRPNGRTAVWYVVRHGFNGGVTSRTGAFLASGETPPSSSRVHWCVCWMAVCSYATLGMQLTLKESRMCRFFGWIQWLFAGWLGKERGP